MAEVKLENITFNVHCICGKDFKAEDFEPECPFCDRLYEIHGSKKGVDLRINEKT